MVKPSNCLLYFTYSDSSQKVEGPIGDLSRMKPSDEVGMSRSRGWEMGLLAGL